MLDACVNKIYNQCHIHDPKEAKEKVKYFCDDSWPLFFGRIAQGRCTLEADLCADTSRLLKLQKTLSTKYNASLNGLSIHDTIQELLQIGELKEAERIRSDFKVPERRFWWLRVLVLSGQHKWDELEKLAKSKRSPIGYDPFVEVCLKQDNVNEARKYITRCRDNRRGVWYLRAK